MYHLGNTRHDFPPSQLRISGLAPIGCSYVCRRQVGVSAGSKQMRHLVIALLAATTLGVGVAAAADLPTKAPMYSPAPVFSWTGFYVGLNAGYGWANTSITGVAGSSNLNGFLGGAQIGYNWQGASPLVLGIEAYFQGTGQRRSDTALGITVDQSLPWFGTVRGRIGYAFDRTMIYATGGLAYADYKLTVSGFGQS